MLSLTAVATTEACASPEVSLEVTVLRTATWIPEIRSALACVFRVPQRVMKSLA